ncbi:hypothetical protein [Fortiea contorta]|uniref:hypothetical protein n=1 Tax=Fortiea contorta TaxID=1892405 RepID=UPI0012B65B97|nr:hypothetical protein [Fortiea contorta]
MTDSAKMSDRIVNWLLTNYVIAQVRVLDAIALLIEIQDLRICHKRSPVTLITTL